MEQYGVAALPWLGTGVACGKVKSCGEDEEHARHLRCSTCISAAVATLAKGVTRNSHEDDEMDVEPFRSSVMASLPGGEARISAVTLAAADGDA